MAGSGRAAASSLAAAATVGCIVGAAVATLYHRWRQMELRTTSPSLDEDDTVLIDRIDQILQTPPPQGHHSEDVEADMHAAADFAARSMASSVASSRAASRPVSLPQSPQQRVGSRSDSRPVSVPQSPRLPAAEDFAPFQLGTVREWPAKPSHAEHGSRAPAQNEQMAVQPQAAVPMRVRPRWQPPPDSPSATSRNLASGSFIQDRLPQPLSSQPPQPPQPPQQRPDLPISRRRGSKVILPLPSRREQQQATSPLSLPTSDDGASAAPAARAAPVQEAPAARAAPVQAAPAARAAPAASVGQVQEAPTQPPLAQPAKVSPLREALCGARTAQRSPLSQPLGVRTRPNYGSLSNPNTPRFAPRPTPRPSSSQFTNGWRDASRHVGSSTNWSDSSRCPPSNHTLEAPPPTPQSTPIRSSSTHAASGSGAASGRVREGSESSESDAFDDEPSPGLGSFSSGFSNQSPKSSVRWESRDPSRAASTVATPAPPPNSADRRRDGSHTKPEAMGWGAGRRCGSSSQSDDQRPT